MIIMKTVRENLLLKPTSSEKMAHGFFVKDEELRIPLKWKKRKWISWSIEFSSSREDLESFLFLPEFFYISVSF